MKMNRLFTIIFVVFIFTLITTSVIAEDQVIVDFYYSETCGSCKPAVDIIDQVILHYAENNSDNVVFFKKEITSNTTNRNEMRAERGKLSICNYQQSLQKYRSRISHTILLSIPLMKQ